MSDMRGSGRTKDVLRARVIFCRLSGCSTAENARRLGKAYTTICYYNDVYYLWTSDNPEFVDMLDRVRELL